MFNRKNFQWQTGAIPLFGGLYVLIGLLHEPWRDEAQAWMIMQSLPALGDLFEQLPYEGAPSLWYLLLWPLVHGGFGYEWVTLWPWLTLTAIAALVLWHAPWPPVVRCFVLVGYFLLYEYAAFGRPYALIVLGLFGLAILHPCRYRYSLSYGLILLLLANLTAHGLVLALAFGGWWIIRYCQQGEVQSHIRVWGGMVLMLAGAVVSIWTLWPPDDLSPYWAAWHTGFHVERIGVVLQALTGAFLPFPEPGLHFWNSTLVTAPSPYLAIVGGAIWFSSVLFLRKSHGALALYLTGSIALMALFYLKYPGYLRHHGLIWILWLVCWWIAIVRKGDEIRLPCPAWRWGIYSVLTVHVLAAAVAWSVEWRHPFTAAGKVAGYLQEQPGWPEKITIAAYPTTSAVAVLPYLPEIAPKGFYMLDYAACRTHWRFDETHFHSSPLTTEAVVKQAGEMQKKQPEQRVWLLTTFPLPSRILSAGTVQWQEVWSMKQIIEKSERFYLYRNDRKF